MQRETVIHLSSGDIEVLRTGHDIVYYWEGERKIILRPLPSAIKEQPSLCEIMMDSGHTGGKK